MRHNPAAPTHTPFRRRWDLLPRSGPDRSPTWPASAGSARTGPQPPPASPSLSLAFNDDDLTGPLCCGQHWSESLSYRRNPSLEGLNAFHVPRFMLSAGLCQVGGSGVRGSEQKPHGELLNTWDNYWASRNDSSRENRSGSRLRPGLLGCSRSFMHSRFILRSACT